MDKNQETELLSSLYDDQNKLKIQEFILQMNKQMAGKGLTLVNIEQGNGESINNSNKSESASVDVIIDENILQQNVIDPIPIINETQ